MFITQLYESKHDTPKKHRNLAAWIKNDSPYLRSYLSINMWQSEAQEDLESLITHELLHLVLDRIDVALKASLGKRFRNVYEEMVESVVENLEAAFRIVRKGHNKKERK